MLSIANRHITISWIQWLEMLLGVALTTNTDTCSEHDVVRQTLVSVSLGKLRHLMMNLCIISLFLSPSISFGDAQTTAGIIHCNAFVIHGHKYAHTLSLSPARSGVFIGFV